MRVGIYVRVSTADQNNELQRRELREYAEHHGWGIAQVYEDTVSGSVPLAPSLTSVSNSPTFSASIRPLNLMTHIRRPLTHLRRVRAVQTVCRGTHVWTRFPSEIALPSALSETVSKEIAT